MKYWVNNNKDVLDLFKISKHGNNKYSSRAVVRFETEPGQQAQFDFKESVKIKMIDGKEMSVYIACLLFSYSRFRLYVLMPDLTTESVIQALAMMFEKAGCVPKEILFDNAKAIMIEARTSKNEGKVNPKLSAFAKDMGFEIKPCVARRPQTKGKVESQMKVLDDLYAYSGDLDFDSLVKQIEKIETRENYKFHSNYQKVPTLNLNKEKEALPALNEELLKSYLPQNFERIIDKSGMIKYENNNYSVDNNYINKKCNVSIFGNYLIIKYSTNKFVSHLISDKIFNYSQEFYQNALSKATNLPLNDSKLNK
ncbi:DDE-type integrase/transposase/recombinase [Oceanivirga miroungae]|uniref:Integrase catalytic domain-containing protein n=1 Tax=Oceanivirga miroungae TaxID=1130046 RepID=A0A6I8MCZ1_9FUSO|nr:DDE-type integrase/transposase/recombinase [Oceanivirga miroungae]VWL84968.1 hypothetical protein OMES3154_00240 [Oceanivirga miroungae]